MIKQGFILNELLLGGTRKQKISKLISSFKHVPSNTKKSTDVFRLVHFPKEVFNPFHATGLIVYPMKTLKIRGFQMFLMFSRSIEHDQWHERIKGKLYFCTVKGS